MIGAQAKESIMELYLKLEVTGDLDMRQRTQLARCVAGSTSLVRNVTLLRPDGFGGLVANGSVSSEPSPVHEDEHLGNGAELEAYDRAERDRRFDEERAHSLVATYEVEAKNRAEAESKATERDYITRTAISHGKTHTHPISTDRKPS